MVTGYTKAEQRCLVWKCWTMQCDTQISRCKSRHSTWFVTSCDWDYVVWATQTFRLKQIYGLNQICKNHLGTGCSDCPKMKTDKNLDVLTTCFGVAVWTRPVIPNKEREILIQSRTMLVMFSYHEVSTETNHSPSVSIIRSVIPTWNNHIHRASHHLKPEMWKATSTTGRGLQLCPSRFLVKPSPFVVGPCHCTGLSESDRILTSASLQRWGCRTKSTSDNWPVSLCIHAWL